MRSGPSAHDGRGWQPAHHPHPGRGPQPDRGEVPLGPEVSWPSGFRQVEFDSGEYRQLVESSYARDEYEHVDPRYNAYQPQPRPGYQAPMADDFGYGDPGYADPSYDGPRDQARHTAPAPLPPAYPANAPANPANLPAIPAKPPAANPPGYQPSPRPGAALNAAPIYPVTGAQEVYRGDFPLPQRQHRDEPRYDASRPADPRLAGLRYDEPRYDDSVTDDDPGYEEPRYEEPRYDEPMDDDAWYEELRRGGPAFPQHQPDPASSGSLTNSQAANNGPARKQSGYQQAPGSAPGQTPGQERGPGSGYPNQNGNGPRMSAAQAFGMPRGPKPAPVYQQAPAYQPAPAYRPGQPAQLAQPAQPTQPASAYAPPVAAPVGVLTPPAGSRFDAQHVTQARAAAAMMVGPDTAVWEETDSLEEYWEEDQDDDNDTNVPAPQPRPRRIGRRRGGSNDHRLWLGLGGVVVVAAAAIFGIIKFEFPSGGTAHELVTPAKVAGYSWASGLEKNNPGLPALVQRFRAMLGPTATNVVSREYESGPTGPTNAPQIVMFLGGHVPNESPAGSVGAFLQQYKGAQVVDAGPMGGEAVCVETTGQTKADDEAICAWFDDDGVGALASPSMDVGRLAIVMRTFRPSVELVKK